MLSAFEQIIADAERHFRRSIRRIETFPLQAEAIITLGCGHRLTFTVASHPVSFFDVLAFELDAEMDCPMCGQ